MVKSKKKQTIRKRQLRTNKNIKNKPPKTNCNRFCEKDYLPEMNEVLIRSAKKWSIPYEKPSKDNIRRIIKTCKKTFCNEKCEGYGSPFFDKPGLIKFH